MDFIAQERDRLLRSTTRVVGVTCALVSVVGIVSSFAVPLIPLLGALACIAVLIAALLVFGTNGSVWWTALALASGLGALALLLFGADPDVRSVVASAVVPLAAGSLSAPLMAQRGAPVGLAMTIVAGVAAVGAVVWASGGPLSGPTTGVVLGWVLVAVVSVWIARSIPRVARRIQSIGTAHRAERQASETEAQRRQGARLLHDTVLATLTLLAHSGVGVSEQAMREQAAEDARLLRHLRLGATRSRSSPATTRSPAKRNRRSARPSSRSSSASVGWGSRSAGTAPGRSCSPRTSSTRSCWPSASAWRTSAATRASARPTSPSSTTRRPSAPW